MSDPRAELQAVLAEALADPRTAHGYRLVEIAFRRGVEIALEKGGATFTVWLRSADEDTRSYKRTARFKVGHKPDPPDSLGYALIDALCARLDSWERTLTDADIGGLFAPTPRAGAGQPLTLEWLAVRSGLKPACRNLVRAPEVASVAAAAQADGLHLEHSDARGFLAGFTTLEVGDATTIVHVGRTAAAALAAAEAERAMIAACADGARVSDEQVRALGAALGYPTCCVEAFVPLRDLSNPEIRFHALSDTAGDPSFLLNDLIAGEQSLVSHCLCRYDCAPSQRYAAALLEAYAGVAPSAAQALRQHLAGVMVAFRHGSALRLATTGVGSADRYHYTAVDGPTEGEDLVASWREALSRGNALELHGADALVLRDGREVGRLDAPRDDVLVRRFA